MTPFSYYALYIFLYIFLYNFLYIVLYIFFLVNWGPGGCYQRDGRWVTLYLVGGLFNFSSGCLLQQLQKETFMSVEG